MAKPKTSLSPAEFQVLLALVDGPKHGHRIKLDVRDGTDGGIVVGPGTLYGAIKRLLERDWIEEVPAPRGEASDDERRRYYRATGAGLRVARNEAHRLQALVGMAQAKRLVQR
jgi:DNA-binding PadR family transcriptional regulator